MERADRYELDFFRVLGSADRFKEAASITVARHSR
jgi:hypothetical protein